QRRAQQLFIVELVLEGGLQLGFGPLGLRADPRRLPGGAGSLHLRRALLFHRRQLHGGNYWPLARAACRSTPTFSATCPNWGQSTSKVYLKFAPASGSLCEVARLGATR